MSRRETGWYWVKFGDEWVPAHYDPEIFEFQPWWLNDCPMVETDFNEIGEHINKPGAPLIIDMASYAQITTLPPGSVGIANMIRSRTVEDGRRTRLEMLYAAVEYALHLAGSSLDKHHSPADALNWLVEHHKVGDSYGSRDMDTE